MAASNRQKNESAYKFSLRERASTIKKLWPIIFFLGTIAFIFGFGMLSMLFTLFTTDSLQRNEASEGKWQVSHSFPPTAKKYLPIYQQAAERFSVPWPILAAIHQVETNFSQNLKESSVGARGHMQFMDKTWVGWGHPGGTRLGDLPDHVDITNTTLINKYGGYGIDGNGDGRADPEQIEDAIHTAAKYLAANRGTKDWFARGGAVWNYNHDFEHYVLKVKQGAMQLAMPVIASGKSFFKDTFLWPLPGGKLTSNFGERFDPLKKIFSFHDGIDIAKDLGSPIVTARDGIVVESRESLGYGWKLVVDHGDGLQTLYAHMFPQDVKVIEGQRVRKGEVIALVGNNGWSTGPHLHFEIHRHGNFIDPANFLSGASH